MNGEPHWVLEREDIFCPWFDVVTSTLAFARTELKVANVISELRFACPPGVHFISAAVHIAEQFSLYSEKVSSNVSLYV